METIDFLALEDDDADLKNQLLRQQAKNILDSYHQEWDALSELLQNAVDAIDDNNAVAEGIIDITFNRQNHELSVHDNGVGVGSSDLKKILRPSVTLKHGRNDLRGEKGVGLSFLLFSTDELSVESCREGVRIKGSVENAFKWVTEQRRTLPLLRMESEDASGTPSYTRFTLRGVNALDGEHNIFSYSRERLKYVLRTRTAAGNTERLFGKEPQKDIRIRLTYVDENGVVTTEDLSYSYDAPHFHIKPSVAFAERQERLANNEKHSVTGKSVYSTGTFWTASNKEVKYYYFVGSRTKYVEMAKEILGVEDKELIHAGIFLSTKTMPTGVQIPPPSIGKEGYWSNIYIVFEYDELKLDPGRKSVPGRTVEMLKREAEKIYNEVKNHFKDILDTDDELEEELLATQTIDDTWDHLLQNVHDLNVDGIPYFKEPQTEQGVVALFHELVGNGTLGEYRTWRNSSRDTYDTYIKYQLGSGGNPVKVIGEFKYEASDAVLDILNHKKEYAKINLIISWSVDAAKITSSGFSVRRLDDEEKRTFNGVTHELRIPGAGKIEIICLQTLLNK